MNGLIVLGSWTGVSAQFVNLTHSKLIVCDREMVIFNCSTSNSIVLAWSTDNTNYINDRVEVVVTHALGIISDPASGNNNVEVSLVYASRNSNVIVSRLSIQVSSELGSSSVICHNSGMGTSQTATFIISSIKLHNFNSL